MLSPKTKSFWAFFIVEISQLKFYFKHKHFLGYYTEEVVVYICNNENHEIIY